MEFYQLRYFEEVARFESVSKAAEELHISQPALSKSIAKLESELGVQLFDRIGKRIALNDCGANFRESAVQLLVHVNESVNAIKRFDESRAESVSISVYEPRRDALACTMAFMKENPDIRVDFRIKQYHERPNEPWTSDIIFAAVRASHTAPPPVGIPYSECKLSLVFPQDHPLADRETVSLSEVADEPLIFLTAPYRFYELSYRMCIESGFSPIIHCTTESKPVLLSFVRNGFGIGLIDAHVSEDGMDGISIVNVDGESSTWTLCFACRELESLSPAALRYAKFMFDYFGVPFERVDSAVYDYSETPALAPSLAVC